MDKPFSTSNRTVGRGSTLLALLAMVATLTACGSTDNVSSTTTVGPAPTSSIPASDPDDDPAGPSGPVDVGPMAQPLIRENLVIDPPALDLEGDGGWVVDLTDGLQEPLFDMTAIGGNFGCCLGTQDWAVASQGTSALVFVQDEFGEGLDAGSVELGVLVRPVTPTGLGAQEVTTLSSFASGTSGSEADAEHPYLIKAFSAGDRLVVVDFSTNDWWRIEADGEISEHQLSQPVMSPECGSEDCIDSVDIQGLTGRNLVSIDADRSRLVLNNPGRADSGSVALVSIDLESGAVVGPVSWPVPSDLLTQIEDAGGPSCLGTQLCVNANTTYLESDPNTPVLNTFDPETLDFSYPSISGALAELTPTVFADGLLWTGGTTTFTDLDGNEIWTLGAHLNVLGVNVAATEGETAPTGMVLAENESGDVFRLDPDTGEIADPVAVDSVDTVVALSADWVVADDGQGSLVATALN